MYGHPYAAARRTMVRDQISRRGIRDRRVLAALQIVPRHEFVPRELRSLAYTDQALPIGEGQTISQPYVVAVMTEMLELEGHERVLEIGTGSGFQTAVLAELTAEVYSIEFISRLAARAAEVLRQLDYRNVRLRVGDGSLGWPEQAPFDRIVVTAAPTRIPPALVEQLEPSGRLIVPVGDELQQLQLVRRTPAGISVEHVLPVRFVPMLGMALTAATGGQES